MAFSLDLSTGRQVKTGHTVVTTGGDLHRINCPFCEFGYTMVFVKKSMTPGKGGEMQVDLGEVRQCVKCDGHFKLKYRMQLYGVPLEDDKGMPYASPHHPRRR